MSAKKILFNDFDLHDLGNEWFGMISALDQVVEGMRRYQRVAGRKCPCTLTEVGMTGLGGG